MLLEIAVAMPIVLIALGLFVRMLFAGTQLRSVSREDWICTSAAQNLVEEMRNESFRESSKIRRVRRPRSDVHKTMPTPAAEARG